MAESQKSREADDDERDDEREDAEDEDASPAKAPNVAGAANVEAARSGSDDADEDEDEDDAPPPAATPAKKAAALGGPKPKKAKVKKRAVATAAPTGGARVAAQPTTARQPGALGKSLLLFVIVVGGLAAGFALLGRDGDNKAPAVPKWAVGQTVDVEITVVPSDRQDLACASKDELGGRHCQFEERNRPWKSADADEKVLKPYTTTDRVQFLAAGLWDQPALKGKLPTSRFSVKCKYKVEGKLAKPWIRWAADGQWFERVDEWYAGPVTDCTIAQ